MVLNRQESSGKEEKFSLLQSVNERIIFTGQFHRKIAAKDRRAGTLKCTLVFDESSALYDRNLYFCALLCNGKKRAHGKRFCRKGIF